MNQDKIEIDQVLDAKNLLCPMPVIKIQQAVSGMKENQLLEVFCTDPGVKHDVPAWIRVHGHQLLLVEDVEQHSDKGLNQGVSLIRFLIRVLG